MYGPTESTDVRDAGTRSNRCPSTRDSADRSAAREHRDPSARHRSTSRCRSASPASCTSAAAASRAAIGSGPALTAERFIPHPVRAASRERASTGQATWSAAGRTASVEFLGRLDDQVKIRGFRVEPGEIEAALGRHEAVREAVVLAPRAAAGDRRLVAYVVPAPGAAVITAELRRFLGAKLPEHLVPATFVVLDALPLTPNGKVDRRALPEPRAERIEPAAGSPSPRTLVEKTLAAIWSELLAVPEVGLDDDFFALGGHSLLVIHVATRVGQELGVDLPVRSLFEAPTLAGLAALVEELRSLGVEGASIRPLDRQALRRKAPEPRQET